MPATTIPWSRAFWKAKSVINTANLAFDGFTFGRRHPEGTILRKFRLRKKAVNCKIINPFEGSLDNSFEKMLNFAEVPMEIVLLNPMEVVIN